MTDQPGAITQDEGLLAGIAHLFGWLVALIVWATQKDKSRYVRFQSIQAMAYDVIVYVVLLSIIIVIVLLAVGIVAVGVGDIAVFGSQNNPAALPVRSVVAFLTATPLLLACVLLPAIIITFVIRLIATIQTIQGKNFYYPWLGKWVESKLT